MVYVYLKKKTDRNVRATKRGRRVELLNILMLAKHLCVSQFIPGEGFGAVRTDVRFFHTTLM